MEVGMGLAPVTTSPICHSESSLKARDNVLCQVRADAKRSFVVVQDIFDSEKLRKLPGLPLNANRCIPDC
jgi:hypothetical protein